ncbi:MAG TPA: DUF1552 domain-containing protein [Polyangiaceae bacterium]|nr:DUF1552 domain-containing protein [Polyangiaceae bacterium]
MKSMHRRSFLRGLGGVAIALPLLEIMLDDHGEALAGGSPIPKRYVLTFGGFSLITDSEGPDGFIPDQLGPAYDLKPALMPLGTNGVQDRVSVVSGLSVALVAPGSVPPPGGLNWFHRKAPAWFCGQRVHLTTTDKVPLTSAYSSSDQIVADALDNGESFFHSLVYRAQVQHYHTVEAWADDGAMSWRKTGSGDAQIETPQTSPQAAFASLVTPFAEEDPAAAQAKALELSKRGSILDVVDVRGTALMQKLGAADRQRVDEHLSHVRDLEKLVTSNGISTSGSCQLVPDPGADPPIGGDNPSGFDGWASNAGYSDEDTRARVFTDLLHMALTCDLTRAATLMYTFIASALNVEPISGVQKTFHSFHHGQSSVSDLNLMIAWHVDHFARLVAKLRDTPEGSGSVLDNCALVMMNEGGRAAGNGSHTPTDLAFLVAGGAGGLKQGEHIRLPLGTYHPAHVLITAMNAVGVPTTQLGEMTGAISELTA